MIWVGVPQPWEGRCWNRPRLSRSPWSRLCSPDSWMAAVMAITWPCSGMFICLPMVAMVAALAIWSGPYPATALTGVVAVGVGPAGSQPAPLLPVNTAATPAAAAASSTTGSMNATAAVTAVLVAGISGFRLSSGLRLGAGRCWRAGAGGCGGSHARRSPGRLNGGEPGGGRGVGVLGATRRWSRIASLSTWSPRRPWRRPAGSGGLAWWGGWWCGPVGDGVGTLVERDRGGVQGEGGCQVGEPGAGAGVGEGLPAGGCGAGVGQLGAGGGGDRHAGVGQCPAERGFAAGSADDEEYGQGDAGGLGEVGVAV